MFSIFFHVSFSIFRADLPLRHFSTSEFSASCSHNFTFKIYICVKNFSLRLSVSYFIFIPFFWYFCVFCCCPPFSPLFHRIISSAWIKVKLETRKNLFTSKSFSCSLLPFLNMTFLGIIIGLTFTAAFQQVFTEFTFFGTFTHLIIIHFCFHPNNSPAAVQWKMIENHVALVKSGNANMNSFGQTSNDAMLEGGEKVLNFN